MSIVPDAAVSFLLDNLVQILKYNYKLVKDVDGDIKGLQKELEYLESLMKHFINYNHDSDYVKLVVKDIKSIIDDAEDVVDTYVLRAAVQKSQSWLSQKFRFIDYPLKLRDIGKQFQEIRERINKIQPDKARNAFEILKAIEKPSKTAKPKGDPKVEEEHVVGFDGAIKEVSRRLTGGSEQLEVISIVGMLGLGKTTLAKKVFNHPDVDFEYMIRVFVYISKEYERREVFLKILRSFMKIDDKLMGMPDDWLEKFIRKNLEGKQYLIVLDDVWEKEDWDRLKDAFPNNKKRCRVLITTRQNIVAEHAKNSSTPPYKLDFLPDDKSQELLHWKVFCDNNFRKDIDPYEEQIAKKCDGLPLAIVVIAGIISNQADRVDWWKRVAESVEEYMVKDQTTEVIELMYKHLPNHLKLCFMYLGVFPEDFEIPVWKLVRLWIAEGLIRESTLNWEDVAEEHLDELVYRNLVIVGQRRANGKIKTCTVHDALREFCKNQAKEENLFQEIKKDNLSFLTGKSDQHRRLCIHNANVVDFISSPPPGKCIRSLLTFAKEETAVERKYVSKIPKTFRLLRVLEIQALKFHLFPIDINSLVLLKYIAISSKFGSLPETMSTLWNMQTLIVKTESPTLEIKADIWKMPQLRHLHTNASTILPCPDSKNQKKKNEVLIDQKIQTLSTISPESCTREILGRTGKLKKLGIRGGLGKLFENSGGSSLFDNLKDLAFLENLKLVMDDFESPIASLPSEKSFPPQLTILSLYGTQLAWKKMAKLGKLENLEILKLKEHAFKGKKWQTAKGGFLKLKHLHIGTTDLEDWEASADHFPYLKCLELHGCDKLKAVPAGFSEISSLQSVDLHGTNTEVVFSAKTLQAEKDKKNLNFKLSVYLPYHLMDNSIIVPTMWQVTKGGSGYDSEDSFSIPKCMEVLNAMDIEDMQLYYRGTNMLLDHGIRQVFMTMPPERRLGYIIASV